MLKHLFVEDILSGRKSQLAFRILVKLEIHNKKEEVYDPYIIISLRKSFILFSKT